MMVQMEKFIELTRRMYPDALSGQSALDFRIAVYDAHCCNALLSRHLAESAGGERAVLRSWSAVALAKVAFVLNIGEKSDSMERTNSGRGSDGKYWPSYVGGEELHIPPERFHHLRSEIADDGHLLNFCTLGGRIVSAILEESSPINVQRPRELLARITERVCAGRQSLSSSEARNKLQRLRDQTHTALVQPTPSRDKEKSDFLVALSDMMQEIRRSDLPDDRDDLELPVHGERAAGGGSVHIPRFWSPRPPRSGLTVPS
ncbi:hypothetical protein BC834DRAFT_537693 [Gloeopeniophorella convolvens]|nr:hypothetical protein BC834DRAFT_537693 [Gloeopeniophorella convolvens]